MIKKIIIGICALCFLNGCSSAGKTQSKINLSTHSSEASAQDGILPVSDNEESDSEDNSEKSGFKCLIDRIASGIS